MTPKEKRILVLLVNSRDLVFGPVAVSSWRKNGPDVLNVYHEKNPKDSWWFEGHNYFERKDVMTLIRSGCVVETNGSLCITEWGIEQLRKSKKGGLKVHRDRQTRKDRNVKGRNTLGHW